MKKITFLLATIFCFAIIIISCKKQNETANKSISCFIKDSTVINVDSCKNVSNTGINICFDTLLSESRCPTDAVCIGAGFAAIRLKCNINNQNYFLDLATDSVNGYKKDTTIDGINIKLAELTPYPNILALHLYDAYKAKIIVGK